ncbi:hypothetical protein OG607_41990 [Streptomyces sp. NBC_01537]|uniref:hypothetical protein n=1 Tax=Streptomyces sp. NBC_01537 TaxID=2903896 RepID=UPI0038674406
MRRATRFQQLIQERHLHIYETFCLHYKRAAKEVAQLDDNPGLASVFVSRSAFDRWVIGDIKGLPRAPTCRVLGHLLGEPAEVLFGPPDPADGAVVAGEANVVPVIQEVGSTGSAMEISPHLAAMDSFRLADRQLGGGHVYRSVMHYLRTVVAPGLFGTEEQPSGEQAFCAAAVLTEMAAWMAHDSGRDDLARGHFAGALRLGQTVTDASVAANILVGMSHLALQSGHAGEAADLARGGLDRISKSSPVPMLSSRLHAMEARALARLGDATHAQRALEAAHEELGRAGTSIAPEWVAPFDEAALSSESASTLLDLGVLPAAAREAERALALRDAGRARSRVFGQIALTQILLAQGHLEAACAVGNDLLGACQSLGSLRISHQLADLGRQFTPYRNVGAVGDLLDRMAVVAQHRRLLLASLALPEGPQA